MTSDTTQTGIPIEVIAERAYDIRMTKATHGMPYEKWDKINDGMRRAWVETARAVLDAARPAADDGALFEVES